MNTTFAQQLNIERAKFAVATNGVIAAPLAGGIYWSALAVLSLYVSIHMWCLIAFVTSGLIFPLALALQKPTKSNMMLKNAPLMGAGSFAFANMALGWAIVIPVFHTDPQLVPIALGVGMSLHLVGTAWSMNIKSYLIHPLLRAAIVIALWYSLPDQRFTTIPVAIAVIYFATISTVRKEVAAHKKRLATS